MLFSLKVAMTIGYILAVTNLRLACNDAVPLIFDRSPGCRYGVASPEFSMSMGMRGNRSRFPSLAWSMRFHMFLPGSVFHGQDLSTQHPDPTGLLSEEIGMKNGILV